jgi:hypothetical protein
VRGGGGVHVGDSAFSSIAGNSGGLGIIGLKAFGEFQGEEGAARGMNGELVTRRSTLVGFRGIIFFFVCFWRGSRSVLYKLGFCTVNI